MNFIKKYYSIFLLLLILLAISVNTYISYKKLDSGTENTSDYLFVKTLLSNISFIRPFELKSEGYELILIKEVIDEEGNRSMLEDLFQKNENLLVYRFSESHCDACITQHLNILNEMSSQNKLGNLIVLSTYYNSRRTKVLRQTHKLNFKIYNTMEDLGIPLDLVNNPYFFILNKNMKCQSFFVALKEYPELTISNLESLFQNN